MTIEAPKSGDRRERFLIEWPKFDLDAAEAQASLLAKMARQTAWGRDVLLHGTRFRERILASGFVKGLDSNAEYHRGDRPSLGRIGLYADRHPVAQEASDWKSQRILAHGEDSGLRVRSAMANMLRL
jgi:hypothetical protein